MRATREADVLPGARRRAGTCPPEGRLAGPAVGAPRAGTFRSTLLNGQVSRSQVRGAELGFSMWPYLASGPYSSVCARIVNTDRGPVNINRPSTIPGTLQLTVLVPVVLGPARRTEADVAGIGTTWTKGAANEDIDPSLLSMTKADPEEKVIKPCEPCNGCNIFRPSSGCDTCRICLQPFKDGDKVTALPCAAEGSCPSVWHEGCVRKWLCQGHAPSCPLCRATIGIGVDSDGRTTNSGSFALEVRAEFPLSAASAVAAATSNASNSSGSGGSATSNQLLQQLGQVLIQDILQLTLSQPGAGAGPQPASGGGTLLSGPTDAQTSASLADLGGLLVRSLAVHGTLPITLTAVETRVPGSSAGNSRAGTSGSHAGQTRTDSQSGQGSGGALGKGRRRKRGPRAEDKRKTSSASAASEASTSRETAARPEVAVGKGCGKGKQQRNSERLPKSNAASSKDSGRRQQTSLRWVPTNRSSTEDSRQTQNSSHSWDDSRQESGQQTWRQGRNYSKVKQSPWTNWREETNWSRASGSWNRWEERQWGSRRSSRWETWRS
mmetsp:Transcript_84397/g.149275  ORF Transcript_84397/g.149275 Transcript_84397/m.149275 type:complete len:551 (-) Transcript_84397:176-1828(-)